jgi:hypothetical protein
MVPAPSLRQTALRTFGAIAPNIQRSIDEDHT